MNKKNKNKNRSKPVNPTPPPQKTEPELTIAEPAAEPIEENTKSLVKESDSVIETISEVSVSEVPITNESGLSNDTPKKPKRNKGKKKKQDDSNFDDSKSVSSEAQTPAVDNEVKVESKTDTESNVEEEKKKDDNIAPSTRKKKNKKKQNEQSKVEESCEEKIVLENVRDDVHKEDILTDTPLKSEAIALEETEPKQPKKKNKKKKNRNDSEKSDKADETITCTAAFQKLLSSAHDDAEVKEEEERLTENMKHSAGEGENKEIDISVAEKDLKNLIESVMIPEETEKEAIKDESAKSKKKNKKEKKHHQQKDDDEKSVISEVKVIKEETCLVSSTDVISSKSVKNEGNQEPLAEQFNLEEETSKSKAKIVKPVEKKRKGKSGLPESYEEKSEYTVPVEGNISGGILEKEKLVKSISKTTDLLKPSSQTVDELPKITETDHDSEHISKDKAIESHILTETHTSPIEISSTENIDLIKPDASLMSIDFETETNKMLAKDLSDTKSEVHIKPISSPEVIEDTTKDTSAVSGLFKTVEKKKKKHHKKIEMASNVSNDKSNEDKVLTTPETEIINKETTQTEKEVIVSNVPESGDGEMSSLRISEDKVSVVLDTERTQKEKQTPQKEDIFFDLSGAADVEISSLKTDDMDGSSDVTPDFIHHPLASSQQLIDENNNMLIQEITPSDEKFTLPILIPTEPIVQGSGETPDTEKILEDPTTIRRDRSKKSEPEKTDLKSKMMEVNQDMEELRLSIERSLAELTSMEKKDQDDEKRFIESDVPTMDIVTEPKAFPSKDDQLISGIKSMDENVKIEIKNPIISEGINQTNVCVETKETKKDELIAMSDKSDIKSDIQNKDIEIILPSNTNEQKQTDDVKDTPPAIPSRKEHKGKGKGKRKGRQETQSQQSALVAEPTTTTTETISQDNKQEQKSNEQSKESSQKSESNENKGKQQTMSFENDSNISEEMSPHPPTHLVNLSFEPIENFEDALTSSVDDVNKTFEMIANEVGNPDTSFQNPEINIIAPTEDTEIANPKQNPVSPPKNLLGQPDIPVPSNRTDYKKEKNKPPNMRQAKVKIKDAVDIEKLEKTKQSKESQTENKRKLSNIKNALESFSYMTNENTQYIYKYSFRKVFLQSLCHVCRKELAQRVPCQFCSLVFYCSQKHKDEDWPQHQSLCFAVCTIVHLKDQKHIYADAKHITGHNYRLLRMQMIVSCEKVLKRKLVPWEQEAFLYPRICADVSCREWKQSKLTDCEGCEQISYCSDHQDHLPTSHQRWCRSYALYKKLVHHQQTKGRLEPKLPTRVMAEGYRIPEKINEVLASMYDEKIDMNDTEYAALTQLATAPLTAAYCHQKAMMNNANGISKKSSLVIHIVGAELQFEADVLHKWEVFFLHVKPEVKELRVVLISNELNPSNLPLDLLGKINVCETCKEEKRRVFFSFQDKKSYYEYWSSDDFHNPDLICAFNPSIQRSSLYNSKDTWPTTISCILKLKIPFVITSYSINELQRDVSRIKECSEESEINFKLISDPQSNPFASVRPDRNFITDDEIPLLFKNYCFAVLCGI